jgi:hypothetical protein
MDSIYKTLNARLRKSQALKYIGVDAVRVQLPRLLGSLNSFGQLLLGAVHSLRPEAVELFRGGKVSNVALAALRSHVGEVLTLTAFSSFSVRLGVARRFLRLASPADEETVVIFRLRSSGRGRLDGFGNEAFQSEAEVLLPPFSTMVIEGVTEGRDPVVIELVDLPVLPRAVESDDGGAFEGVGDGFLWLKATVTPDFEGVEWTRVAKGDFEVLAKFEKNYADAAAASAGGDLGTCSSGVRGFAGVRCGGGKFLWRHGGDRTGKGPR